ncbi:MAG: PRTRC system protein D [Burkholderiales bacterium]|jgi:plasmid segregation protein ParM|nr:MAG: PRTRC system protein D [Burkholderiales bacterium]
MASIIRAIDVGFGNTKYVTTSAAGKIDCAHFPSIAYFMFGDVNQDAMGTKRRTVAPHVDGLYYEVGPDVELASDRFRGRNLHDGFSETPEYRALLAGALHYMKVDRVDLLVLGLPVAQYVAKKAALEKLSGEVVDVGRKRKVALGRVIAVAQPQGALFAYATQMGAPSSVAQGRSLVVDVGSRTFDWLVTNGMKVVTKMSDSVTRGVSDVLIGIAKEIGRELKEDYRNLEAIDLALRSGKKLRAYQREYDLKRYDTIVQKIADQAVIAMVQSLDGKDQIENIVLVGGGAQLFRKAVKKHFPRHEIYEVSDPIYANVRGFQLLGELYAREKPELFLPQAADAVGAEEVRS